MKKVIVNNLETGRVIEHDLKDDFFEFFIQDRKEKGKFGKLSRWLWLDQATEFELSREDDRREVEVQAEIPSWIEEELDSEGKKTGGTIIHEAIPAVYRTEIHVPDDFTVTVEDITAQYEQEQELQLEIKKRAAGSKILAYINTVNNSKGYTSEQYLAMYQNSTIQFIKMMLENGALGSAKATLDLYVVDTLIDQDYKDRVSTFIQNEIDGL